MFSQGKMQSHHRASLFCLLTVFIVIEVLCSGCISPMKDIIQDDALYQNASRDHFTFNTVHLKKDVIRINISYGGGCADHEFALIASSFMESEPVQVNVVLSHEDHDDPCDMWITQEEVFNLVPLKRAWQQAYHNISGIIVMNLEGYTDAILYHFNV